MDWDHVYRAQMPRVYNFFRYRTGDDLVAQDLTAITFERAWRSRERYCQELGRVESWLFAIARNVAKDYFQQYSRQPLSIEVAAEITTPDTLAEDTYLQQEFEQLQKRLAELPARDQELIALKYGADLTNRAIAQLTGLSETNVSTLLYRLIRKLRSEWEA